MKRRIARLHDLRPLLKFKRPMPSPKKRRLQSALKIP